MVKSIRAPAVKKTNTGKNGSGKTGTGMMMSMIITD